MPINFPRNVNVSELEWNMLQAIRKLLNQDQGTGEMSLKANKHKITDFRYQIIPYSHEELIAMQAEVSE